MISHGHDEHTTALVVLRYEHFIQHQYVFTEGIFLADFYRYFTSSDSSIDNMGGVLPDIYEQHQAWISENASECGDYYDWTNGFNSQLMV